MIAAPKGCFLRRDASPLAGRDAVDRGKEAKMRKAGNDPGLFLVRPAGRTHLEVGDLYSPDKGKS
jgi:hypothetical protein